MSMIRSGVAGVLCGLLLAAAGCAARGKTEARRDPAKDPVYHYRWAVERLNRGQYMEALDSINRALALDPDSYAYHDTRGHIYLAAGEFARALENFRRALELNPYYSEAHNNIGVALQQLGRSEEALAEYEKVLADPKYPHKEKTHFNIGSLYQSRGDLEQAAEHYRKAVAIEPDYLPAHYKLGLALRSLGRTSEARRAFEEVLRLAPQSPEGREVKQILESMELGAGPALPPAPRRAA